MALVLALAPASAVPDPGGGKGKGPDHAPPGQASAGGTPEAPGPPTTTTATPPVAETPPAPQPTVVEVAASARPDKAVKKEVQQERKEARAEARAVRHGAVPSASVPPSPATPPVAVPAAVAAPPPAGDSGPGASATAAPTPAAAAPAPSPASAPAATPAPARRARGQRHGAVRVVSNSTRAAERRHAPRGPVATRLVQPLTPAVAPAPAGAPSASTDRPRRESKSQGDTHDAAPRSPLQRTVVRVLEVIPPELRVALAALAGLGLILAAATFLQARRARRLERQRRSLIADVGLLQSALLPALPARIGDARVSAAYRPAEGLAAGGDFYDAFELPGGNTAVIVGDVAGHGRDVIPITALVRYSLRAYLDAGLAPRTALQVAAAVLEPQLGERLVTVIIAVVDPVRGRLTYATAGHPPPMFLGIDPDQVTACSSPPIGAGVATGRRQTTVGIAPGVVTCFVTDGLADARLDDGRLGPDRVAEELAALERGANAENLLARVVRRTDAQPDDMAVCMVSPMIGANRTDRDRVEELEVDPSALESGRVARFLTACGVLPNTAIEVLRQADGAIARTGSAVLTVHCGDGPARVKVTPRLPVALPLAPACAGLAA